jgi:methylenetetrahydrofolate dehydrogenase (NADP+)/methenyltetrahydrofolate cyclohydrolase
VVETKRIDGKAAATILRAEVAKHVSALKQTRGITPGLAVVLVGNDSASEVYVRNKEKAVREAGMNAYDFHLPENTTQDTLLAKVDELNRDINVHGILVQLPLPKHIDERAVLNAIDPKKDVDGFHIINAGKLATGQEALVPCTPWGCLTLLHEYFSSPRRGEVGRGAGLRDAHNFSPDQECPPPNLPPTGGGTLAGKHAIVIGRSNIVGKPMAQLLLKENCTVTIAHSKTKDLAAVVKVADIVVAAVGRPNMVKGEWLKKGAVVIDVGINRIKKDGKTNLVGDVDFESCQGIAGAITPVPGGVGPMTIACLLENTLKAATAA